MFACATPPSGDSARSSGSEAESQAAAAATTGESPAFSGDPRETAVRVLVEAEAAHGRESPEAARARVALADLEFRLDIVQARALYQQSLSALRREAEDAPMLAVVLQRLGRISYLLGDLPTAITRTNPDRPIPIPSPNTSIAAINTTLSKTGAAAGAANRPRALSIPPAKPARQISSAP